MIRREITSRLETLFVQYPFVTVTGPRQSGKTTLCRATFPDLPYANLEAPDQRDFAESDPRGFLAQLGDGGIIDEVQHVPALLSYLQVFADERGRNSLFVLTGSEQFRLSDAIGHRYRMTPMSGRWTPSTTGTSGRRSTRWNRRARTSRERCFAASVPSHTSRRLSASRTPARCSSVETGRAQEIGISSPTDSG